MQLNTGEWVVVGICGVLLVGYILGYLTNRQRAEKIFAWLKQGLSTLGEVSMGEKLPGMSTGGRLEVNQAVPPMKRVETIYLLAPRENLLFWLFHLLQGRGDELIVWVTYQSKPEQSIEVARQGDRQFAKRLLAKDKPAISLIDSSSKLQVAAEQKHSSALLGRVQAFLQQYPSAIKRLVLRPEKPHLFLRVNLRLMQQKAAAELFNTLKELGG